MDKKTFYDCYLVNWNCEMNRCSPKECTYGSAKKMFFHCPNKLHEDTLKPLNNITNKRRNHRDNYCLKCNSFSNWCITNGRQYLLELWDYDLNKIYPEDVGYASNNSYYFKCERGLHKSHKHVLSSITCVGNQVKCKKCNSIGQFGLDNIDNFFEKYWSNKNTKNPYDISIDSDVKIWIICQICGKHYEIRADHFSSGVRHNGCSLINGKSKLQRKVEKYIEEKYNTYTLLHENHCTIIPKSPITNYNMYFDNEIKELRLLAENDESYKILIDDKISNIMKEIA